MSNYLIMGSGLIGRLTAWRLLLAGHQVSILSKDDKQGTDSAGFIAASMISPATEAVSAEPIVKAIGMRSYALWPEWLKDLPAPIYYQDKGTIVVAHKGDEPEMARFKQRAKQMLGSTDYQQLDQQMLAQREPELADNFSQGMWFQQESCVDNRQLYRALTEVLSEACDWKTCEDIQEINPVEIERLCKHYFACPAEAFDTIIDCRGNGAKANLSSLRSVRGELIRVHAPDVSLTHAIRLMHPRYPFYLAPRPNHEYCLGATVIESDDRSEVTLRSGLEMMSALYSLHKGFAEARILEMRAHCRPGLPDNLPTIQRTEWGYIVNGFYRHGYLFGPAIIHDLLALIDGNHQDVVFGDLYVA
jgi:glycine oxidase